MYYHKILQNEVYSKVPSFNHFKVLNVNSIYQQIHNPAMKINHVFTSRSTKRNQISNHRMPFMVQEEADFDLTVSLKFPISNSL